MQYVSAAPVTTQVYQPAQYVQAAPVQAVQSSYSILDLNKDGKIDASELAKADFTGMTAAQKHAALDANGDGVIDANDFKTGN